MFQSAITDTSQTIENLSRMLRASRRMQAAFSSPEVASAVPSQVIRSASIFPSSSSIREFEHSAIVLQLYAAYENCVSSLVRLWLRELPNVVSNYQDLGSSFHHVHRVGVAGVLGKINYQRFSHLSADIVSLAFSECAAGHPEYEILPEAFIGENRTLKKDRLCELLSHIGVELGWDGVTQHPIMKSAISDDYGDAETAESVLKDFVSYRNDAAHGRPNQILGYDELLRALRFIDCLCTALAEVFSKSRVMRLINSGKAKELGTVKEVFAQPRAIVAELNSGSIRVGTQLIFHNQSQIVLGYVRELQLDGEKSQKIEIRNSIEVGIKLDVLPKKSMRVLIDAG